MTDCYSSAHGRGTSTARRFGLAVIFFGAACARPEPAAIQPGSPAEPVSTALALQTFDSAWSRVANTHYDTAFGGVDWPAVRTELRPRAEGATTLDQLRVVISTMLARLGDSHYGLIPREAASAVADSARPAAAATNGDIGAELRLVDGEVLVWRVDSVGPAAAAGIGTGWRVVAIDGQVLAPRLVALARVPAAQQRVARTRLLYQVNALLKGTPGHPVALRLERAAGNAAEYTVTRREQPGQVFQLGNLPPIIAELTHTRMASATGCVGLIRLTAWMAPLVPQFDRAVDALRDCQGIIIDVRGNPGGLAGTVMGTAGHFLTEPVPLGFMRMRGATELRFKANPRRVRADGSAVEPFAGRVAILTDEMSGSTSEFFAAGLQGVGRARVFGGNTAGQALPAVTIRLPTNDVLMHVLADFTGPTGERIEGRGVQPDVDVPLSRRDLLNGRDAPLRAALDWITGATRAGF